MNLRVLFMVLAVTVLGGIEVETARGQLIPVNACGQTLDAAGEYILTTDLDCSAATGDIVGVEITASDVVFHLAGRTISSTVCDENRNVTGIFAVGGLTNVRIDGGNVTGFNDGIVLSSDNSSVVGVKVTGACFSGIHVQGTGNRLEKNTATGNGDGVLLLSSNGALVRANNLSGNSRNGLTISGENSDNNVIAHNIIGGNGAAGGHGVAIINGTNNFIRDNAVNHNRNGIFFDSPGNRARNNVVSGSADIGISVSLLGRPSVVRHNTVFGSGATDMTDQNAGCSGNTWRNNTFVSDLVNGLPDGGPGIGCLK